MVNSEINQINANITARPTKKKQRPKTAAVLSSRCLEKE